MLKSSAQMWHFSICFEGHTWVVSKQQTKKNDRRNTERTAEHMANPTERSTFWRATWYPAVQEIICIWRERKNKYHICNSRPLVPILKKETPEPLKFSYFFRPILILYFHLHLFFKVGSLLQTPPQKIIFFSRHAIYTGHIINLGA